MASPKPIPLTSLASCFRFGPNSWKIFLLLSFLMPSPLSVTEIRSWSEPFCALYVSFWTLIRTDPFLWVNFMAFDKRLSKTCWSLFLSVFTRLYPFWKFSNTDLISMFFMWALSCKMDSTWLMHSCMSNSSMFFFNLPYSLVSSVKSRMSWTK